MPTNPSAGDSVEVLAYTDGINIGLIDSAFDTRVKFHPFAKLQRGINRNAWNERMSVCLRSDMQAWGRVRYRWHDDGSRTATLVERFYDALSPPRSPGLQPGGLGLSNPTYRSILCSPTEQR